MSDNGTIFLAGAHELREVVKVLGRQKIVREIVSHGISRKFNPPCSPHSMVVCSR